MFAVRLIHRYSYVLGESPNRFIQMSSARQGRGALQKADEQLDVALMCINDDLPEDGEGPREADEVLATWFEKKWPEKLDCER